jgi:hypothetical protein
MTEKYVDFLLHLKQPIINEHLACLGETMCGHAGYSCSNCSKRGFQSFQTLILTKEKLELAIKSRGQEILPETPIDESISVLVEKGLSKVFSDEEKEIVSVVRLSDGYVWGESGH